MATAAALGITASKLMFAGACLGVGFWASRKLTGLADEYLLRLDKEKLRRLSEGYMEV